MKWIFLMSMRQHKVYQWLTVCVVFFLLTSCHTIHPKMQTSEQQIMSTLNHDIKTDEGRYPRRQRHTHRSSSINTALLPPLSHYVSPAKTETPRFDVAANNIPAREFFMGLVAETPVNIIVSPAVTGTISLNLKNVTLHEALDAIRDIYGYEYHRTSYGYEISPPQLETQVFHVNYLDIQRTGRSYTQLTTGQVSNKVGTISTGGSGSSGTAPTPVTPSSTPEGVGTISSIETKTEMQFFKDLEKAVTNIVGKEPGRSVTMNAQAGVIIVRAYPNELHRVASYLNNLQSSLNRQVILEAKILEVQLNDSFQAGIDWAVLANVAANQLNQTGNNNGGFGQAANSTFNGTDLTNLNGIFAIKMNGNFKLLINLLQTQGNVQILSSPHISTVNNQKAVIKVGSDEFFVTGVSTSNTIIGTNTIPSQDVSLTPFFSGITLDVTPEISSAENVILHIHPSISTVTQQTKTIVLGASSTGSNNTLILPLAFSTIRESDNIVRAKNGQVVVIGGLMQNVMNETIVGTPWVSKIPFIGSLFRRTEQISTKSELVILLRPIVVTNQAEINKLRESRRSFVVLKRPFQAGGLPKIFGNEGERINR